MLFSWASISTVLLFRFFVLWEEQLSSHVILPSSWLERVDERMKSLERELKEQAQVLLRPRPLEEPSIRENYESQLKSLYQENEREKNKLRECEENWKKEKEQVHKREESIRMLEEEIQGLRYEIRTLLQLQKESSSSPPLSSKEKKISL